jgi:hypothetical protein
MEASEITFYQPWTYGAVNDGHAIDFYLFIFNAVFVLYLYAV